jgi:class 3 adenylate cyclase
MCASCGRDNPYDARFCNSCGAALATTAPEREARKTVTVLFCDVTGSTRPNGSAWEAGAVRVDGNLGISVTAYAVCTA